jgi:hypothetical protein
MRHVYLIAAAIGLIASIGFAGLADAGTCMPVNAKGMANNMAKATTLAQANLQQKAIRKGGKVTQASTNCVPGVGGYVCKISAVVCPK